MRPLRYPVNITLDGCCDHRVIPVDEEFHRHALEELHRHAIDVRDIPPSEQRETFVAKG